MELPKSYALIFFPFLTRRSFGNLNQFGPIEFLTSDPGKDLKIGTDAGDWCSSPTYFARIYDRINALARGCTHSLSNILEILRQFLEMLIPKTIYLILSSKYRQEAPPLSTFYRAERQNDGTGEKLVNKSSQNSPETSMRNVIKYSLTRSKTTSKFVLFPVVTRTR